MVDPSSLARNLIAWTNNTFNATFLCVFMVLIVTLRSLAHNRAMIDCRDALIKYDAQPSLSADELKDLREREERELDARTGGPAKRLWTTLLAFFGECIISGLAFYASIALMVILPIPPASIAFPPKSFSDRSRLACHDHTFTVALGVVFFSRTRLVGRLEEFIIRPTRRVPLTVSRRSPGFLKEKRAEIAFAKVQVANRTALATLRASAASFLRQILVATSTGATGFLLPVLWILYEDPTIVHEGGKSMLEASAVLSVYQDLLQRRRLAIFNWLLGTMIGVVVGQRMARLYSDSVAPSDCPTPHRHSHAPTLSPSIAFDWRCQWTDLLEPHGAREAKTWILVITCVFLALVSGIIRDLFSACRGYDLTIAERQGAQQQSTVGEDGQAGRAGQDPAGTVVPEGFVREVDKNGRWPELVQRRTHAASIDDDPPRAGDTGTTRSDENGTLAESVGDERHLRKSARSPRSTQLPVYNLAVRTVQMITITILALLIFASSSRSPTSRERKQTSVVRCEIGILDLFRPDVKYYPPVYLVAVGAVLFGFGLFFATASVLSIYVALRQQEDNQAESGEQAATSERDVGEENLLLHAADVQHGEGSSLHKARESGRRPVLRLGGGNAAQARRRGGLKAIYELWTIRDSIWINPVDGGDKGAEDRVSITDYVRGTGVQRVE
ncbi:hypothetical protein V8E36_005262 [Tilletia maclaganii]